VTDRPNRGADLAGFMVGLASLWIQVLLIRRLMAAFTGNELTIGITLAAWMVWTGLGAILPARLSDRIKSPRNALALVFLACAALLIPALLATAKIKIWLGLSRGEIAGLPALIASSFIITAPVCALLGFAFNLAAKMQEDFEVAAGRAYRFEALGAFFAGAVLAVWFSHKAGPLVPGLVMCFLLAIASLVFFDRRDGRGRRLTAALAVILVAAPVGLLALRLAGVPLENAYQRLYWGDRKVAESFDSKYGYLAAVKQGGEVTIFEDGSPSATFPDPEHDEILAHLPLALCPRPWNVLLIGGGFTGMAREILKHPVERLDYVQLDPGWLELERRYAPGFDDVDSDPRAVVHEGDGRTWLKGDYAFYDVVIVNLPDPFTAGLNRYYTAEFFAEVKNALMPWGVFALTAGSTPPNRMHSQAEIGLLAGVTRTVDAVFPNWEALPLHENLILAGDTFTPLVPEPERIENILKQRGIESYYSSPGMIAPNLEAGLLDELKQRIAETPARVDRDLDPRGYLYGIMLWAERASPLVKKLFVGAGSLPVWSLVLIPVLIPILGWTLERRDRALGEASLAAGVSGFAGIVIEVSVLITFQVLAGSVYFAIAVLTASFMVGLAAGAYAWEELRERASLLMVEVLLVVWAAITMIVVWKLAGAQVRGVPAMAGFCALLLGQGAIAGALFPAAAAMVTKSNGEVGTITGRINGAEHMGSAMGGLLAGAFMVPVFGIIFSLASVLMAALALLVHSMLKRALAR
jgi:spermidine synthase